MAMYTPAEADEALLLSGHVAVVSDIFWLWNNFFRACCLFTRGKLKFAYHVDSSRPFDAKEWEEENK